MKQSLSRITRPLAAPLLAALSLVALCPPLLAQESASIVAVVNGEQISSIDLAQRTDLVLFATGLPRTREAAERVEPQVLQKMVDEMLQLQAAREAGIKLPQSSIDGVLANMERENKVPPGQLGAFLAAKGVELSALVRQVEVSLSWVKLIERKFAKQASVGDDDIDDALRQFEESLSKPRNLVSEIFLAVEEPGRDAAARQSAMRVIQQLQAGASFDGLARAFSQNAAAANGGDLGWVIQGQLGDAIESELANMRPGQLAGPIRTSDGYHIIALRDRRLPGGSSPNQVTVDLRQINIPLDAGATQSEVDAVLKSAADIRGQIKTCDDLEKANLPGGGKASNIGRVRIGDLAAPLQPPLMGLRANQISEPLRTKVSLMLLMVCDREAKEVDLPSREQVRERLFQQKLDLLARRYLRDLRRAAYLELRR